MTRIKHQQKPVFCIFQTLSRHPCKMHDKLLKKNKKFCSRDCVIPFLIRASLLCLIWSFKLGLFKVIYNVSKFFRVHLLLNELPLTNHLKLRFSWFFEMMCQFSVMPWIIMFTPTCYYVTFCRIWLCLHIQSP